MNPTMNPMDQDAMPWTEDGALEGLEAADWDGDGIGALDDVDALHERGLRESLAGAC
jgi:hypothetical protein